MNGTQPLPNDNSRGPELDEVQNQRRSFLKKCVAALLAPTAVIIVWPLIQSIVGTIFRLPKSEFTRVGRLDSFPVGQPVSVNFEYYAQNMYMHSKEVNNVWVIKHSDSEVTVFSPICTHLGCRFEWFAEAGKFVCPCHDSIFSETGKVLGGPAPRPLDTLPYKIENGSLFVKLELFRVGIPSKVRVG